MALNFWAFSRTWRRAALESASLALLVGVAMFMAGQGRSEAVATLARGDTPEGSSVMSPPTAAKEILALAVEGAHDPPLKDATVPREFRVDVLRNNHLQLICRAENADLAVELCDRAATEAAARGYHIVAHGREATPVDRRAFDAAWPALLAALGWFLVRTSRLPRAMSETPAPQNASAIREWQRWTVPGRATPAHPIAVTMPGSNLRRVSSRRPAGILKTMVGMPSGSPAAEVVRAERVSAPAAHTGEIVDAPATFASAPQRAAYPYSPGVLQGSAPDATPTPRSIPQLRQASSERVTTPMSQADLERIAAAAAPGSRRVTAPMNPFPPEPITAPAPQPGSAGPIFGGSQRPTSTTQRGFAPPGQLSEPAHSRSSSLPAAAPSSDPAPAYAAARSSTPPGAHRGITQARAGSSSPSDATIEAGSERRRVSTSPDFTRRVLYHVSNGGWSGDASVLTDDALNSLCEIRDELALNGNAICRVIRVASGSNSRYAKSQVAAQLAWLLAERGDTRVLLMEADLDAPAMHKVLRVNVPRGFGFSEQLERIASELNGRGASDLTLLKIATQLHVLVEGRAGTPTFFDSPPFAAALEQQRREHDVIVIDGPVVDTWPDSQSLQGAVDGVVFVVASGTALAEAKTLSSAHFEREKMLRILKTGEWPDV
jgi:Mrp family chromosome partitioning ATPase